MTDWLYSFRVRLTLLFGGLSLVIGAAATIYVEHAASARITRASGESLRDLTLSIANALTTNLIERDREMALLAQYPAFVSGALNSTELRQRLDHAKRTYRYYAWIGVADVAGVVQSAADGLLQGANVMQRPWFIYGRQGAYIGDVHEAVLLAKKLTNPNPGEPLRFVDFASPILGADGRVRGVLASHAHWSWVQDAIRGALREDSVEAGREAFVLNSKGEILYPFRAIAETRLPAELPRDEAFATLDWGDEGRFLTSTVTIKAGTATELGWRIVLRQPLAKALAPVSELHRTLLLLGALATAVFMVLAYRLASGFGRPVEQLADAAQRIERGEEDTQFSAPSRTRELILLADSLRGMTANLIARRHALQEANLSLEQKVAERTAELSDLYHYSPVGYHSIEPDGTIHQINDRELQWLGYERDEVVGRMHIRELIPPGDEAIFYERQARMKAGATLPPMDVQMVRRDGSLLPVRISSAAVFDDDGRFLMSRSAVMDVTEQRKLELELRSQQLLNQAIIHTSASGLLLYREDGQCVLANEAAADIVGLPVERLLEQNFHDILHWRSSGLYEGVLQALRGEQNQRLISSITSVGKPMDCLMTLVPMRHEGAPMVLVVAKDVSELVKANRELEQLARRDTLTGLANRLAATERLRAEFLRTKRTGVVYAVLLMDIDHFKRVNDGFGHETGDAVLRHVAGILAGSARTTDLVARFGGEEFLILLPDTCREGAAVVAEKIRAAVADSAAPQVGRVTLSVGVAVAAADDLNEDEAVRRADQGLYRAKAAGRNRVA